MPRLSARCTGLLTKKNCWNYGVNRLISCCYLVEGVLARSVKASEVEHFFESLSFGEARAERPAVESRCVNVDSSEKFTETSVDV